MLFSADNSQLWNVRNLNVHIWVTHERRTVPSEQYRLLATFKLFIVFFTQRGLQMQAKSHMKSSLQRLRGDSYGRGDDNTARTDRANSKKEPNAFQYVLQVCCLLSKQQEWQWSEVALEVRGGYAEAPKCTCELWSASLTITDGMGKYDGMGKDIKNTKYNIKY